MTQVTKQAPEPTLSGTVETMVAARLVRRHRASAACLAAVVALLSACGDADPAAAPSASPQPTSTLPEPEIIELDALPRAPAYQPAPQLRTLPPLDSGAAPTDAPSAPEGVPAVFDGTDLQSEPRPAAMGNGAPRPTEVLIQDLVTGDGAAVAVNDTAVIRYVAARYRDGTAFDSSWNRATPAVPLPLRGTVAGFREGMAGMREGGRRLIVVPASGGYGSEGAVDVPPDTDLVYIVDLVKVSA